MTYEELIELLRQEGESLGALPLSDVDVPTCPDWSLPDLVVHVGTVHRWQEAQLHASDPEHLVRRAPMVAPDLEELPDWFHTGLESLIAVLSGTDPDRLTPSWFGPRPAAFWARRAAHETAVHRWDAEAAITTPTPLGPRQAVDLLDEILEVLVPGRFHADLWTGPEESIHLHATDIDGEWFVVIGADGVTITHEHAKGDLAARGSASDLALMVAGRVPPARLELFGDPGVIDRWHRMVRL